MSNLFGHVLSVIFFVPCVLFGFDLVMIQSTSAQMETFATSLMVRASRVGVTTLMIKEAEENGYRITCISGCQNPQIGQTQNIELIATYHPLFISSEQFYIKTKRSYVIGYY